MNYNDVSKSVRRIAKQTLSQDDLAHHVIIRKGNTYQAFNDYTIEETSFGWQVTSNVFDDMKVFNTAKVALAWCMAHKYCMYKLATAMELLDRRVATKQFDIDMMTVRLDNNVTDNDDRAILVARLMEDINSRQMCKKQLAKCVETAKYIKIKGTNSNELSRINKAGRR